MINLVIEGSPPRKNAKHRVFANRNGGRGVGRTLTASYKAFCERVARAWLLSGQAPIVSGSWHVRLRAYWPRMRHLDTPVPCGDVDAPVESVLDALEKAGAIDDDARVVAATLTKHHDKTRPRIEVELRKWEP